MEYYTKQQKLKNYTKPILNNFYLNKLSKKIVQRLINRGNKHKFLPVVRN